MKWIMQSVSTLLEAEFEIRFVNFCCYFWNRFCVRFHVFGKRILIFVSCFFFNIIFYFISCICDKYMDITLLLYFNYV